MIILFSVLLLVWIIYIFGFPLYRKRPILLTRRPLLILVILSLLLAISIWLKTLIFLLMILVALVLPILLLDFWIAVGISGENISSALSKAVLATQTKSETLLNGLNLIEPAGKIGLYRLIAKSSVILFDTNRNYPKHQLMKKVFRKFIDNYTINS